MSFWCRLGLHTWMEYPIGQVLYRRCFDCEKRQRFVPEAGWVDDPTIPDYLKDCKGESEHNHEN